MLVVRLHYGQHEEEIVLRMCSWAAATVIIIVLTYALFFEEKEYIPIEPSWRRDLFRNIHIERILGGSSSSCVDYLRIRRGPFMYPASQMRDGGLLRDTIHLPIEQPVAMFLHIVGHKAKK